MIRASWASETVKVAVVHPIEITMAEEVDHEWRYPVNDLQQQRQEQSHRGLRQLAALAEAGFRVVAP
ncbi:MAG: hypothetical protein WBW31_05855 [Candidatus Sulfotelmatobacter sp.]